MAGIEKGSRLEVQREAEKHIRGTEYHKVEVLVKTPEKELCQEAGSGRRGWRDGSAVKCSSCKPEHLCAIPSTHEKSNDGAQHQKSLV